MIKEQKEMRRPPRGARKRSWDRGHALSRQNNRESRKVGLEGDQHGGFEGVRRGHHPSTLEGCLRGSEGTCLKIEDT